MARETTNGGKRRVQRKTGRTANSITMAMTESPNHIRAQVGTRVKIAMILHEGADPHPIRPRRAGGTLRFYWDRVGRVVYFRQVSHPGVRGSAFLTDPLRRAARKYGFGTVINSRVTGGGRGGLRSLFGRR